MAKILFNIFLFAAVAFVNIQAQPIIINELYNLAATTNG